MDFGASWERLGRILGPLGASWGVLGASWGPLGASWGPLGGLLGALKKDVGADGAVFNMISRANKKVSETVAPRGPFFKTKNAILYCILHYFFSYQRFRSQVPFLRARVYYAPLS